ncbi:MAG: hypothetical protein WCC25_05080 [Candidatus Korobacteraceae bacterium]
MSKRILFLSLAVMLSLASCSKPQTPQQPGSQSNTSNNEKPASTQAKSNPAAEIAGGSPATSQTKVLMHNVILDERPGLQLRVRWLRGEIHPTRKGVVSSFDDPGSFVLDIQSGIIATSLSDISRILNSSLLQGSPLEKVSLAADGERLKLKGTLHKGVSLPIEMVSEVSAAPDGRVRLHMVTLRVLKLPVKGLVRLFHISVQDLIGAKGATNVQVSGNDIFVDPEQMLPAPAIRGELTDAHIGSKTGDLVTIFGDGRPEANHFKQWRNFIRLYGGTINMGKLTMAQADIFMIDLSNDDWFSFDLMHYQEQLVNGRIQMTPQAGLRIFMPDIEKIPHTAQNQGIIAEWMKNRKLPPPETLVQ